jgi:hypothetical protein
MHTQVQAGAHVSCLLVLSNPIQQWDISNILVRLSNINFLIIICSGVLWPQHAEGREKHTRIIFATVHCSVLKIILNADDHINN